MIESIRHVLREPGLPDGAYCQIIIDTYRVGVMAYPASGCAVMTDWLLPAQDTEGVTPRLIEAAVREARRHKSMVRTVVPSKDLQLIAALRAVGFSVSVLQDKGRKVELTRRFV